MAKVHLKVRSGLLVKGVTADPSDAEEGDLIFRSDLTPPRYREYRNGNWADIHDSRFVKLVRTTDTVAGSNAAVTSAATPFVELTAPATLVSIDSIPAGEDGQTLVLLNSTGTLISVNDEGVGTAANRIRTGTSKPAKLKDKASITLIYNGGDSRWHIIGGTGSGDSSGNELLERLKDQFEQSTYTFMTSSVIATDDLSLIDGSSTGSEDFVNSAYQLDAGEFMLSAQMLDPDFLNDEKDVTQADIRAYWLLASIDNAATYKLSRDGGVNFQSVTMSRVSETDEYQGSLTFSTPLTYTLSAALVTGNSIATNINGTVYTTAFASSSDATLQAIATQIATDSRVDSAIVTVVGGNQTGSDDRVITIMPKQNNFLTISATVTGGASQATIAVANQVNDLYSYAVSNADSTVALTSTGSNQQLAIPFVSAEADCYQQLEVYIAKTGSPSGSFTLNLVRDSSGQPSTATTDIVATSTSQSIASLSAGNNVVTLNIPDTVLKAGTYYITVNPDSAYDASYSAGVNQIALRTDTSAPTGQVLRQYNGTSWANVATTSGCFVARGRALNLRLKITSSTAARLLMAFGAFYDVGGNIITGQLNQQTVSFAGSTNPTSFTITNFTPSPNTLKVYWKDTGRVFVNGDFSINGNIVTFPANTFNVPLEQVTLLFDQPNGAGFDASSQNALNIATQTNQLTAIGEQIDDLKRVALPQISVPNTTIVNRATIPDLSNDLCVRMGVERIQFQNLYQIQNEFGPNGESVAGVVNDTLGLVRLVGNWGSSDNLIRGSLLSNGLTTDYIEVTFYGTGLNVLVDNDSSTRDLRIGIDGGAVGSNLVGVASTSNAISTRGYNANQVINAVSGLTLGIHTAKLVGASIRFFGVEILNTSSTLKVNPGNYYVNAQKLNLSSQQSPAYNSTFESGTLGTKGGRVLVYLKSDGTIGKAVTPTDTTSLTLSSASHANEEVARRYNVREFGAGRNTSGSFLDDFSNMPATGSNNAAFTLDDGTTTLVGSAVKLSNVLNYDSLSWSASGSYITFTFVGTGLDYIRNDSTSGGSDTFSVSIDGGSAVQYSSTGAVGIKYQKIASGLPYGTHTVKLTRTSAPSTYDPCIIAFVVYQPKKPTLPSGAVELADYNIMANFVANSVQLNETVSTGVLRKVPMRELTYVNSAGTWAVSGVDPVNYLTGWEMDVSNTGYFEYTFYGTGFDFRFNAGSNRSTAITVQLQSLSTGGSLQAVSTANYTISHNGGAATGSGPSISTTIYGGGTISFTPSTGILSENNSTTLNGCGLTLNGLTLGLYKVRFTNPSGAGVYLVANAFDVITPIHSVKSNVYADYQNTLAVGSQGLSDNRKLQLLPLSLNKAWVQAVGVTSSISTTSTSAVPLTDMSATITVKSNSVLDISFVGSFSNSTLAATIYNIYVDGLLVSTKRMDISTSTTTISDSVLYPVGAGTHKVDVYWSTATGTLNASSTLRVLRVREV